MKIITAYPIIQNKKVINRGHLYDNQQVDADYENYCNADADAPGYYGPFLPGQSPQEKAKEVTGTTKAKKKGNVVDKGKGIFDKAKGSGVLDSLGKLGKDALNKKAGKGGTPPPKGSAPHAPASTGDTLPSGGNAKPPMSTGAKVAIGVTALAVIIIIYKVATKKGK